MRSQFINSFVHSFVCSSIDCCLFDIIVRNLFIYLVIYFHYLIYYLLICEYTSYIKSSIVSFHVFQFVVVIIHQPVWLFLVIFTILSLHLNHLSVMDQSWIIFVWYSLCPHSSVANFHYFMTWWHHQMETFSSLLAICAGNSPVPGEFPAQRPVTRSFDVFFDLRLNKRLSKQSRGWWFETLSCPL